MADTWENKWSHSPTECYPIYAMICGIQARTDCSCFHSFPGNVLLTRRSHSARKLKSHFYSSIPTCQAEQMRFRQHDPQVQSHLLPRAPLHVLALRVDNAHLGVEPRCLVK
jgi:hypothetical protein